MPNDLNTNLSQLLNGLGAVPTAANGVPVVLYTLITPKGNSLTDETTLATYTLPANTLNGNGQAVRITAWGQVAANGNTKTLRVYFGATPRSLVTTGNNVAFYAVQIVTRLTANTQSQIMLADPNGSSPTIGIGAPSETLSSDIIINVTGQSGTASDDITLRGLIIEWLPAGTTVV